MYVCLHTHIFIYMCVCAFQELFPSSCFSWNGVHTSVRGCTLAWCICGVQLFLRRFMDTQSFVWFVDTRAFPSEGLMDEVRFFDESIAAKLNRSSFLRRKKEETPFLDDKRYEVRRVVDALVPEALRGDPVPVSRFVDSSGCGDMGEVVSRRSLAEPINSDSLTPRGAFTLRPSMFGYGRCTVDLPSLRLPLKGFFW